MVGREWKLSSRSFCRMIKSGRFFFLSLFFVMTPLRFWRAAEAFFMELRNAIYKTVGNKARRSANMRNGHVSLNIIQLSLISRRRTLAIALLISEIYFWKRQTDKLRKDICIRLSFQRDTLFCVTNYDEWCCVIVPCDSWFADFNVQNCQSIFLTQIKSNVQTCSNWMNLFFANLVFKFFREKEERTKVPSSFAWR